MNTSLVSIGIIFFMIGAFAALYPLEFGGMKSYASAEDWKERPEWAEQKQKAIAYLYALASFSASTVCILVGLLG